MKHFSLFALAVAVILTSCASAPKVDADGTAFDNAAADEAPAEAFAPFVTTIQLAPTTGGVLPRSFTGVVKAVRTSELGFKRTGRVEKILVEEGDVVRKGDVLAELDTASLNADLAVTDAERLVAEARLRELTAGPRKQSIDAARAQKEEIEAQREQLRITFERAKRLIGSEIVSQQTVDDARLTFAAAEKRLAAQKHVLAELEAGTRSEQIEAAKAGIVQLDAGRDRLKLELTESRLLAPFDAVVSRRLVDEGAIVAPGLSLLRIVENAPPEAWIGVSPEVAGGLNTLQHYDLEIGDELYQGRLKTLLPELDHVTRTQTAIFTLVPREPAATSGKSLTFALGRIVQLRLSQEVRQPGFWLPLQSLTRGARGLWSTFVLEEIADGADAGEYTLRRGDVEIIQIDSDRVLVRGTLNSGDRVVATGVQKLTAGQRVRIAPETPAPVRLEQTSAQP